MLTLSRAEARRFLATYHFTPTDVPGVFEHLGTVQYDPLNPVGRNPDLVLQARVPGYQVDDWQKTAYTDRSVYDAWDKMACLVPMSDWPKHAWLRAHAATWTPLLEEQANAVAAALAELDARGPLSSLEFEDQSHFTDRSAWYGPKRIKHILRALWDRGLIVTHHRQGGRHYYDRAERVIAPEYFNAPEVADEDESTRWMLARRSQTMGLIRPSGDYTIWFGCGATARRTSVQRTGRDGHADTCTDKRKRCQELACLSPNERAQAFGSTHHHPTRHLSGSAGQSTLGPTRRDAVVRF